MDNLIAQVDGREKGAIPISIGTSLALEAAAGIYPDRPVNPAPIREVKEIWLNVRTLLRNIQGCLPAEIKDQVSAAQLVPALIEELSVSESAVIRMSEGMARAVFYICDYAPLRQKMPRAILKQPTTPKQIHQHVVEAATLSGLADYGVAQDLRNFRYELTGKNPNSFIVTHLPVDLLSRYNFNRLELLESHTGSIKKPAKWNTKLTNGKELSNIPFGRFSLQVFGDNGHQFTPVPLKLRREVLQIAQDDAWTVVTTDAKIRESLRHIQDAGDRNQLLAFL